MSIAQFTESEVESAALAWLESLGWTIKYGPDISPGGDTLTRALCQRERGSYSRVVLKQRLRDALAQLNPQLPTDALEDTFRKLTRPEGPTLEARNRALHRLLVDGVTVKCREVAGDVGDCVTDYRGDHRGGDDQTGRERRYVAKVRPLPALLGIRVI